MGDWSTPRQDPGCDDARSADGLVGRLGLGCSPQHFWHALGRPDSFVGVLMAAAQIYLLWMSQKGVDQEYVKRVNAYLGKLDKLVPGNERVAKMYLFLQRTLNNNQPKS